MRRIDLLGALILSVCGAVPHAASAQTASPVIKAASPTTPPIRFAVVSIRRSNSQYSRGPGFTDDGFSVENNGLFSLLSTSLVGRTDGIPEWSRTLGWDIRAKVADSDVEAWKKLSYQQRDLAVRAMMEDRFHLKWHIETRQSPGYAMVVAKSGPKFKEATPGDTYPNGFKNLGGGPLTGVLMRLRDGSFGVQAITMAQFADSLQGFAGKPVVDKTGLAGKYDFNFTYDPGSGPPPDVAPGVASEPAAASIFTVLQEQLGLKLEPGATVPQDFFVVDHVEQPTEN